MEDLTIRVLQARVGSRRDYTSVIPHFLDRQNITEQAPSNQVPGSLSMQIQKCNNVTV